MKVTLKHPKSINGFPVILDDDDSPLSPAEGIDAVLRKTNTSPAEFAAFCGILPTTLRQYGRRDTVPANVLNVLTILLEDGPDAARAQAGPSIQLTAIEKQVAAMVRKGMTYEQIAEKLGITRQRAHQIMEAAIGKKGGESEMAKPKKPKKPCK